MKLQLKTIRSMGNSFILRLSCIFKSGKSIKLHLILQDDKDDYHSHPWDFTSLILFGGYWEDQPYTGVNMTRYGFFSINRKSAHIRHKVILTRFLGIRIPCITIGLYSQKKQLCSMCESLGYCKTTGLPIQSHLNSQ